MMSTRLLKTVFLASSLIGTAAHAGLVSCPGPMTTDGTAKVTQDNTTKTAANLCQYVTPADNNDEASAANVNAAAFFGTTTWTVNTAKVEMEGEGMSGTWAITGANFLAEDYMIVFKDGKGTNLVGFLFNELYSSGDWTTPFGAGMWDLDKSKGVSHYTIFERVGKTVPPAGDVPEPGILALLGLGMAGFAVARRRSSRP